MVEHHTDDNGHRSGGDGHVDHRYVWWHGSAVGQWGEPLPFCGRMRFGDAGLLHVSERYCDLQVGRFVSADVVTTEGVLSVSRA
jgi:hypothetical protein